MMLFAELASLLQRMGQVAAPNLTQLVVADLLRAFTMSSWFISTLAAFGDLYKDDPDNQWGWCGWGEVLSLSLLCAV